MVYSYSNETVMQAFRLYALLAKDGAAEQERLQAYMADDEVRGLVDQFAAEVDCAVIAAGDELYLIPLVRLSPFHVSNDAMKRTYLRASAVNADLYLMYMAIIVWVGAFYDSYQTLEPTRNFLPLDEWAGLLQERIDSLKEHDEEELQRYEREFSYNWSAIIEKWDTMDDIKETAKRQTGNTISRLSFLDTVRRFLLEQQLAEEVGEGELGLTEKAKVIVQRYFMELEYNRGILGFLYSLDERDQPAGEEGQHAGNLEN
ncbi:non-ribosomal peptide synthetase module [Paenibacillus sp. IB182496]|uniref:Non-ribosomal peptide synthetase module n=1 Tax=Paenibacillus sabuli TaxID=2772509 RepID=A0A927BWD1_9BACL|nr:DUF6063 family protein [Paenibacillus sabuli]MBD2848067.1 non-ribosomal peptide synthetase module [Paenibacillus sabuli]